MSENFPSVAVVILSWNGRKFLENFLPPILKTTYRNVSFYVADNASTDDTLEYLKQNFPSVKIIAIPENGGFAKGYNIALKQVHADYYVLLNQDVEVSSGWIEPVITLMESNPKIAACQPKMKAFHQKDAFEYAGAAGGFIDRNGYAFCRGRFFHLTEKDTRQYEQESEVVWASGACLFIRAKLFHDFEGFDADFFAHMEEIDLCWRLKNAGYSNMYCPKSEVFHVGGGSLAYGNPMKTYLNFRNNLSLLVKNLPGENLFFKIYIRILLDIIAAYKTLLTGYPKDFFAIAKAHFYFFTHIPFLLQKRKHAQSIVQKHKISGKPNRSGFYKGSILWDFFVRRKRKFSELESKMIE